MGGARRGRCLCRHWVHETITCRREGLRLGARTLDHMEEISEALDAPMASEVSEVALGRGMQQAPEDRSEEPRRDERLELVEPEPHRVDRRQRKRPAIICHRTSSASYSRTAR